MLQDCIPQLYSVTPAPPTTCYSMWFYILSKDLRIYFSYRVHGAAHHTAQWVPCERIKEIPCIIEPFLCEELCHTVVEVRIKLMNDTLIFDH